jgi:hypothetical protein
LLPDYYQTIKTDKIIYNISNIFISKDADIFIVIIVERLTCIVITFAKAIRRNCLVFLRYTSTYTLI